VEDGAPEAYEIFKRASHEPLLDARGAPSYPRTVTAGLHGRFSTPARRLRWSLRSRIAATPAYLPLARRKYGHMVVADDTEAVIDGFTRSACVFAAVAFQQAQERPVRLAHLLHAPAHLIAAVERGLPCLATVREPEAAVVSCVIREPYLTPGVVLDAWVRFHARLLPHRDRMVIGEFARVTADLGSLIDEMNTRFGTAFTPFVHTPENVERVFAFIEERASRPAYEAHIGRYMSGLETAAELDAARRAPGGAGRASAVPFEHRVARPSAARQELRAALVARYREPGLASRRERAERVYAAFVGGPPPR
jgi:hypothetical protein